MAKRIRDDVTEGKRASSAPPSLEGIDTNEAARQRSGMAPDQWNAAIRLQCKVRDTLDRSVTLVEALNFAIVMFGEHASSRNMIKIMRGQFDAARRLEAETKNAAADADRKNAGKR
jgi:hypothetical protein